MRNDPEISTTNYTDGKLANNKQTAFEPRWKGGRPDIVPGGRRALAVAEKRRWSSLRALLEKCATGARVLEAHYAGELGAVVKLDEVLAVIPLAIVTQLRTAHLRVLLRLVEALVGLDVPGLRMAHAQIGELAMLSERQARRVVADLVELELFHTEPDFEPEARDPRGLAANRRGNAYVPAGALLALVVVLQDRARTRAWPKNGQASGTEHEYVRSESTNARPLGRPGRFPDPEMPGHAGPGIVEPDYPEPTVVPNESPAPALPETHDETRGAGEQLGRAMVAATDAPLDEKREWLHAMLKGGAS